MYRIFKNIEEQPVWLLIEIKQHVDVVKICIYGKLPAESIIICFVCNRKSNNITKYVCKYHGFQKTCSGKQANPVIHNNL